MDNLSHLQLLLEDRAGHTVQDVEAALAVCAALLCLVQASCHLCFPRALATKPVCDVGQAIYELDLADCVAAFVIQVVEELHEVLESDIKLEALCTLQEGFLRQRANTSAVEDAKELLKSEPEDILCSCQVLAALSNEWIDEAFIDECHVDPLAGHEVDEALEGAFELAMICLSYVSKDSLCLALGENDLKPLKHLLQSLRVGQLNWPILQVSVNYGLQCQIQALKRLLDLLIKIIELLSSDQCVSSKSFEAFLFLEC